MSGTATPEAGTARGGLLPSTWLNRTLKIAYLDHHGRGVEATGPLLGVCALGPVLLLKGSRTVLAWERLVAVTLDGG